MMPTKPPPGLEESHAAPVTSWQIALANEQLGRQNAELREEMAKMTLIYERLAMAQANAQLAEMYYGFQTTSCAAPRSTRQPRQQVSRRNNLNVRSSKATLSTSRKCDEVSTTASSSGYSSEADENSVDGRNVPRTTVMLRNIPTEYTRADIVELIDRQGFGGVYDLVYVPVDFVTELNHGYAFVNCTSPEGALRLQTHFSGFNDWKVTSERICEAVWSESIHGIDAHVKRYMNSPLMHESVPDVFKPALFAEGKRIPFPKPTQKVRAPRMRKFKAFNGFNAAEDVGRTSD